MNEAITTAIVPVKELREAKSRLAGLLSSADRHRLVLAMLDHILGVLTTSPGIVRTLVVTLDEDVATLARGRGAEVLWEVRPASLNGALQLAIDDVLAAAGQSVLIVPGDLPELSRDDIAEVLGARAGQQGRKGHIVIAPSRDGGGTNALLMDPPDVIAPSFGVNSCVAHRRAAQQAGISPVTVRTAGLGFDVDAPNDLYDLQQVPQYAWLRQALKTRATKRPQQSVEVTR